MYWIHCKIRNERIRTSDSVLYRLAIALLLIKKEKRKKKLLENEQS